MATGSTQNDHPSQPNPHHLLTPADVPGFELDRADSVPSLGIVHEFWSKPAPDGSKRAGFVNLALFPLKNRAAALALADELYYATPNKEQARSIGRPTPGSYSGQPVGDFCWAYTVGFKKSVPGQKRSGTLVVVQGDYLFKLQVVGGTEYVDPLFIEKTAKTVASRLKNWPRPPGFDDGNHGHGNDDDRHDDDNPGNGHH